MKKKEKEYSTNEMAEKIVGKRIPVKGVILFSPAEEGYHCPVCKYKRVVKGEFDERLHWSEYNGFIWCRKCDKDFPSALCHPDIDKAITTYLMCVLDASRFHSEILLKKQK